MAGSIKNKSGQQKVVKKGLINKKRMFLLSTP